MNRYKNFICISDLKRLCESIGKEQGALDGEAVSEDKWKKVVTEGGAGKPWG